MVRDGFKRNPDGFKALMQSGEVQAELEKHTQTILRRANGMLTGRAAPFEGDVQVGVARARGMVKTSSDEGTPGYLNRKEQAGSNILLKAAGGGG